MSERRRRNRVTSVRFNPGEFEAVAKLAEASGISISSYIRHSALRAADVRYCELCPRLIIDRDYRTHSVTGTSWSGGEWRKTYYAHEDCFQKLAAAMTA